MQLLLCIHVKLQCCIADQQQAKHKSHKKKKGQIDKPDAPPAVASGEFGKLQDHALCAMLRLSAWLVCALC